MNHNYQKDISGCGLSGLIHKKRKLIGGEVIIRSISSMQDRGNGLGAGFAAYGIYPEYRDFYALHIMYDHNLSRNQTEEFLKENIYIEHQERIPHRHLPGIKTHPRLTRYFVRPIKDRGETQATLGLPENEEDYMVQMVMHINRNIPGAFVFSSGKNMGAFKGVGFPEEIADFFRMETYKGYIWTAHNRFPTNSPGWWGGAHPFTILDWSIVHNGEISSYGINKRYLEMFGYHCTLMTDTEVVAYLLDLLIRRHGLSARTACHVLAPPLWEEIDRMGEDNQKAFRALRMVYGPALLNGPFAILFAHKSGIVGLNDRIKLRPLVAATKGDLVFMASEESAIRTICPEPERVWAPKAGEPVIVELDKDASYAN
jgi:glutamate synthase domain-containing protein 1